MHLFPLIDTEGAEYLLWKQGDSSLGSEKIETTRQSNILICGFWLVVPLINEQTDTHSAFTSCRIAHTTEDTSG